MRSNRDSVESSKMSDVCSENFERMESIRTGSKGRVSNFMGVGFFSIGILFFAWGAVPLGEAPRDWVEFSQQVDWGVVISGSVFLAAGMFFLKKPIDSGMSAGLTIHKQKSSNPIQQQ